MENNFLSKLDRESRQSPYNGGLFRKIPNSIKFFLENNVLILKLDKCVF